MPFVLLRPHYLAQKNRIKKAKESQHGYRKELLLLLITSVIMMCIYISFYLLLRGISNEPTFLALVPLKIIELMFSYFFVLLVVSCTIAAIGNIYTSEHLLLVMQAPVGTFRLYLSKYVETFLETSFMFFILVSPAALAYVRQLNLHWSFLPVGFLVAFLFLLIPVGLGIFVATFMAQIITTIWRRGGILLAGILLAFFGASIQLAAKLHQIQEQKAGAKALAGMMGLYSGINPLWLPSRWASDILGSYITGATEGNSQKLLLLIGAVGFSFAIGYFVFDFMFLRVRSSSHIHVVAADNPPRTTDIFRKLFEGATFFFPLDAQSRAIIVKDLTSLVRDRAQALQLFLYLGLGALYLTIHTFLTNAMSLTAVAQQLWLAFLASSNIFLVGLMTTTILTRLVYPSVSLEGRAFWILQVTPITIQQLIRAKLSCWLPFTSLLSGSLVLVGALAIGLHPLVCVLVCLLGVSISLGTTGLSIGLGSRYANFDWDSPSQISIGLGTLSLLLLSVIAVFAFTVPSTVLLFLVLVPRLREIIGAVPAFFLMSFLLWFVLFVSLVIANYSVKEGSRSLEERLREV